jgi:hypothetical protein
MLSHLYNEFASTSQITQSSQKPSTPCLAGTVMPLNAMIGIVKSPNRISNQNSGKVGGSLEAGRCKNLLL